MKPVLMLICCMALAQAAEPRPASEPDPLGRLFFTASERAELDRIRIGILDSDDPGRAARTVRLDGIVQKNGQTPQIWINGSRYKGRDIAGASISAANLSASTLQVTMPPPDAQRMALKVGQTLDPAGGNLREVYQRPPQELNQLLQLLSRRGQTATGPADKAGKAAAKPPRP